MFLLGVLLVQVLCALLLTNGASVNTSEPASASGTATPTLSGSTVTIDVSIGLPKSSVVEPARTTSTQSAATSAIVQSLLNEANNLVNNPQNIRPTGGDEVTAGDAPEGECDDLNWQPHFQCTTDDDDDICRQQYITKVSQLIKCIGSKPQNVSSMDLAAMMESVGKKITLNLIEKVKRNNVVAANASYFLVKDEFVLGSEIVGGVYINTTKDEYVSSPNYSKVADRFTRRWETVRDHIRVPVDVLRKLALAGTTNFPITWTVFPEVIQDRPLKMTEIETDYNQIFKESDVSDLYLDDNGVLKSRKKAQDIFINSNVISLNMMQSFANLKEPVLITLRHKKDSLQEPSCVYWDTINSIWSRKGCNIHDTNSTHTVCACNHLTMFAVAMKEQIVEDLSDREAVVTTAAVFGVISTILLVGSAICVFVVGYHFVDNMRIALNIELAFLLGHLFFFVGLSNSSSKYVATPATCDVISPFVHMFELAGLAFLLMEGIFYVERFSNVFNKKNTRTFYIYLALGWGLPVALAAACAGYPYSHYGTPGGNEFCWMSVNGVDVWFFGAPVLILVLLNLMVRGVVLQKVLGWKGNPDDINIERTRIRLISSVVLLPVIILTWLFGILATNNANEKVYHYFFIIFHFLQGLLVFIFYCARNTEMWEYYKDRKERELAEKNAVYQFHYVP